MLPVSAWPPGPPGDTLSPFGQPRSICVSPWGYVLPKGAWIVQTGANRVIMFRPEVQHYNPARVPGTGVLPGQHTNARWGAGEAGRVEASRPPPTFQPTYTVKAQVKRNGPPEVQLKATKRGPPKIDPLAQSIATTARWMGASPAPSAPCPPVSRETWTRPTHDQYLEGWRAWQREIGRTDPPIRPLPGRVPPNFFGWQRDPNAPSVVLVNSCSGGTVLADGQNVVIAGCGWANITQAFSV